jgi:hypothetical protein
MIGLLVIVFEIEIGYSAPRIVHEKRKPPVRRDVETPASIAQLMRFPEWQRPQFFARCHRLQKTQLHSELCSDPPVDLGCATAFVQHG